MTRSLKEKAMIERHPTKFLLAAGAAVALTLAPLPARAQVHVSVGIGLPPPVVFAAPPQLVVLPGTYVYAVPDYGEDIFFVDGWWWRPWHGHWYRSHYYDRDWESYSSVPYFYRSVPHDWRTEYSRHEWRGRPWNYERVSYDDAHQNWSNWKRERRWSSDHNGEARTVTRDVRSAPTARHEYRGTTTHSETRATTTRHEGHGAGPAHHETRGTAHEYRGPQHQSHPQGHQPQMHEASRPQGEHATHGGHGGQGGQHSPSHGPQGHSGGGHGNAHNK